MGKVAKDTGLPGHKESKKPRPPSRPRCGAKLRNKDAVCRRYAMANGRCSLHGGKSPKPGPGHPTYKHGVYSKMPSGLGLFERVEAIETNDDLLSLRRDVAILSARAEQIFERIVDLGEFPDVEQISKDFDGVKAAFKSGDSDKLVHYLGRLEVSIYRADTVEKAWDALDDTLESRRKMIHTERTLQIQAGEMITVGRAIHALSALFKAVQDNVRDPVALGNIRETFLLIAGPENRAVSEVA